MPCYISGLSHSVCRIFIFITVGDTSNHKFWTIFNKTGHRLSEMCTNVTHKSTGLVFNLDLRRTLKTNLISNVQHIFTRMLWGRNKGPQTKFCAIFSLNVHINPIFLLIVQSNKLTVTFYIKEFDWRSRTRLQRLKFFVDRMENFMYP